MKLKLSILTILSLISLLFPIKSLALTPTIGPLTVRLGQPKSPTNQSDLKLTFVARQIGGTDNIAIGCYKKSSLDIDFVKFEDLVLIPGGNTDYCTVNSSILNTVGTYSFKIIANSLESNIVTVDYNTSNPSTPEAYNKERLNDCDYKIKFKTANDGKTAKVELFRSDSKSISINSSGLVATQSIGPNTEGEFINSIPVCGKEYFYAMRAVDSYENVSGTTGDSFTTLIYESTTTNTTTRGALLSRGGSQVVEGTPETTITPTESTVTSTESGTPEVLGAETTKYSYLKWIILTVIAFTIFQLLTYKKRA